MIKITPLGSMGWIPVQGRHTCCYCLEYNDHLILLDAGTGMARFDEPPHAAILKKYHKVSIILSHYHLDHTAGLIYLPQFFKEKEVHIAGPGKAIYGKTMKEILTTLISPPYFGRPITDMPMAMHFHGLGVGTAVIDGLEVETILQEHTNPSLGIKIGGLVCYCTDTACSDSTITFAGGCRGLLHESWFDAKDYAQLSDQALASHSHVEWVANAALKAGVDVLMLIHFNPDYSMERLEEMEKQSKQIFPHSCLAKEGKSITF